MKMNESKQDIKKKNQEDIMIEVKSFAFPKRSLFRDTFRGLP